MGHRLTSRNGTVQPFAVAPQIVKGGRPLGALFDDLQDYSAHASVRLRFVKQEKLDGP